MGSACVGRAPHPSHSGPQSHPRSAPGPGCGFYKPENGSQGQPRLSGERGHGDAEEIAPWERLSRGEEAGRAAFTRGRERGWGAGRRWHAGSRRARGSLPRRGASEEDLAHGGAWETASLLVWARLWVRCCGLGEPKKGQSWGAGGAAAILCLPSPREGCDFGGKEGLPLKSCMPHVFSFSFSPILTLSHGISSPHSCKGQLAKPHLVGSLCLRAPSPLPAAQGGLQQQQRHPGAAASLPEATCCAFWK